MRARLAELLVPLGLLIGAGCATVESRLEEVYLLQIPSTEQWCKYSDEITWKRNIDVTKSMGVARVIWNPNSISKISMSETSETGDWIAYDEYQLNPSGDVTSLSRVINVVSEDASISQQFSRREGRLVLHSSSQKSLSSGSEQSMAIDWTPDLPVFSSLAQFPFSDVFYSRSPPNRECTAL